jgi:hypothetical protein
MQTCEYAGDPLTQPRSHPWQGAAGDPDAHYYDLKALPALIRTALEDFRPWQQYAAIETFYGMLERINHRSSTLESNDCAFTGPEPSAQPTASKAVECSGRVTILFRALGRNTAGGHVEELKNQLHCELAPHDTAFSSGMIGTTLVPARYLALPEADGQQLGWQLLISFWAWGDSEASAMRNLARLLKNLTRALRKLSAS